MTEKNVAKGDCKRNSGAPYHIDSALEMKRKVERIRLQKRKILRIRSYGRVGSGAQSDRRARVSRLLNTDRKSTMLSDVCIRATKKRYKCKQCEYSAWRPEHLKRHSRVHSGHKLYKCRQCEYSTPELDKMFRHFRFHLGDQPYKCRRCEYRAADMGDVLRHFRVHMSGQPYKCKRCDYSTCEVGDIRRHVFMHNAEKNYECMHYEYESCANERAMIHLRSHSKKKRANCEECLQNIYNVKTMEKIVKIHTCPKPFGCMQCRYKTFELVRLKMHMLFYGHMLGSVDMKLLQKIF
ncbi:Zinc finger protein 271 [Eumeta japonica]|uniref:Zinc finger protein 271 n=1 Tax=Eumeta variegata TaxID=151549 RepID=A0A4C1ZZU5_EUMVA|nr:Zinc finger protein 271 [Eumeta japonica]